MPNLFNAAEIIDMGIEKEKKRRDFYGMVAEKFSKDKEMKELFTNLQSWEETHIKKFSDIRDGIKEPEATSSYPGEITEYIKAMIDDTLYREVSPEFFSKNIKDPLTAIQYGIGFEKDAILFFRELIPLSSQADKGKIEKLIDEEKEHLVYLTKLKRDKRS